MDKKIPMTKRGYDILQDELRHLKSVERPNVVRSIAEAREHGDLSENAEYHAAREKQGFIEGRIVELEDKLSRADILDLASIASSDVRFGATVTVVDDDTKEESVFQIVGTDEADIKQGYLSITAPLARALIGKKINDSVEVNTPNGGKFYSVKAIFYKL
jgi:transcription elongation factor GreA